MKTYYYNLLAQLSFPTNQMSWLDHLSLQDGALSEILFMSAAHDPTYSW